MPILCTWATLRGTALATYGSIGIACEGRASSCNCINELACCGLSRPPAGQRTCRGSTYDSDMPIPPVMPVRRRRIRSKCLF
ncbi:uncharacterized protein LY79DRAFT_563411 [Colletotrichum navitas]|uniref:Secreted protein n=1 Tax=Colletotrichum navitas TaxID=681940 RepID=A0AAD8PS91_9PEZI|nr:uncharacterized protein LY79DRAFT_563411 [Colletotrichum navitas]KAK1579781.1 hypothetical protein LY79DRAFT_563411 [Colletotrichum navitas]